MLEPETQVSGAVLIFDMDGLSLQQVWQFTPPFAKRIVDLLQVFFTSGFNTFCAGSISKNSYIYKISNIIATQIAPSNSHAAN